MKEILARIPAPAWAVACLAVMTLYLIYTPGLDVAKASAQLPRWQFFVVRWFHSLVWLLLAVSFFIRSAGANAKVPANVVALLALAVYFVFLITFLFARARLK